MRPVTCTPLVRDDRNNVALNDVLGNYSLTLIDSLSTLAILASAPHEDGNAGPQALAKFQDGVAALVQLYGDGRPGHSGQGARGRGFDADSKVQVFETVIRGVGGLLSAHLFAVGELPITGYRARRSGREGLDIQPITWPNGLKYDGQLLRLALDLAQRLLPAFYTRTGMPYPRVNLRHGIPFYANSPLHYRTTRPVVPSGPAEATETCSAGAGSLVLEFTVLSRLTGDPRFEQVAKRAFWAVWVRRSDIGLIGSSVDAESGDWTNPYAMIGASVDSFYEYALKTHILLSGHELPNTTSARADPPSGWLDPNSIFQPLSDFQHSPDAFLEAWRQGHAAVKRHLYSKRDHPHYVNVNLWTGSLVSDWVDSLGAYYSGLLTLAGELEEAIETNMLYAAIWTRYAALPERWSLGDKTVEDGLSWWPLRPELIESTYHLYRATKDPWYLHVGEMVLRDIQRRCWTPCGWAGLQNVLSGEKTDRMESFFLGETVKYLYLLFDDAHPLNSLDAAYVYTTEGHPILIPKTRSPSKAHSPAMKPKDVSMHRDSGLVDTCPAPPPSIPVTGSHMAIRNDLYHPSRMVDLHLISDSRPRTRLASGSDAVPAAEDTDLSFFPWTLPKHMLPQNGICSKVFQPLEVSLEFASNAGQPIGGSGAFEYSLAQSLRRISLDAVRVHSTSGLKLTLGLEEDAGPEWRVIKVNGLPLGRDEFVVMDRAMLRDISDPRFNLVRDPVVTKLVQLHRVNRGVDQTQTQTQDTEAEQPVQLLKDVDLQESIVLEALDEDGASLPSRVAELSSLVKSLLGRVAASLEQQLPSKTALPDAPPSDSARFPSNSSVPINILINQTAVTSTGIGAAPLPPIDIPPGAYIPPVGDPEHTLASLLPWSRPFPAGDACDAVLPARAARDHQVIVMRRGGCNFSRKLAHIPAYTPDASSLQLVIVVSDEPEDGGADYRAYAAGGAGGLIRPLLDEVQHTPAGIPRHHPIAMVMVGGGDAAYEQLAAAERVGLARRYYIESSGIRVRNLVVDEGDGDERMR